MKTLKHTFGIKSPDKYSGTKFRETPVAGVAVSKQLELHLDGSDLRRYFVSIYDSGMICLAQKEVFDVKDNYYFEDWGADSLLCEIQDLEGLEVSKY